MSIYYSRQISQLDQQGKMCDRQADTCDTKFVSKQDAIRILNKCTQVNKDAVFKNYSLRRASDKMLGFLSDYWKLEIQYTTGNKQIEKISLFIKSISKSNASKAKMVKEMNLFENEYKFYAIIREKINLKDLPPWSANLVMALDEAMIFEDLNFLQYKTRHRLETFDEPHTLLALQALARFHSGSLVYEEKKRKQTNKNFTINDEHGKDLGRGGYVKSDLWFAQCMNGALEAIKSFSKYKNDSQILEEIENKWAQVWDSALDLSHFSFEYRNVICHRDLWNNNILFRYKEVNEDIVPDNCVLVDFAAATCQPPAGDVMFLLHCNLHPKFRKENLAKFLNHYYQELQNILDRYDVILEDIMSYEQFLSSCDKYKLWGLITSAVLVPQFWIDDDLTMKYFGDTESFKEILTQDKGSFIKKMMESNEGYKNRVMQVFEEIVDTYCLNKVNV